MLDLLLAIVTGVVATAVMTLALYLVHWGGFANADMIRALGSLLTRSERDAVVPGMFMHFINGIIFAGIYIAVLSWLPVIELQTYVLVCLLFGFAHGWVVSFALVVLVAEHHPLQRFRNVGLGVAVAHLVAHVIFGFVVGLMAGLLHINFDFIRPLL